MTTLWARQALLPDGWAQNVTVVFDKAGEISHVSADSPKGHAHEVPILLPAPVNSHSHAFQRAMAGLTERRGPNPTDSFWTWRDLMFRFLDRLSPEQIEAITAFVQMEMLEAGYATNVEFHYIHHQPGGVAYDNLAELSERVASASAQSGIGLTLLPVHYQYGGLDKRPLGAGQIRFGTDLDQFSQLFAGASRAVAQLPADCRMGVAPHSLRAVAPEALTQLATLTEGPYHMHLAEQIAEVEEAQAALGQRPVEWMLDHMEPNAGMTFIHCTQMLAHETKGLAQSGAIAGLCPITESSLGDGVFDGVRWFEAGGRISIGSDSNIRIALSEELRTLDYSQRLRDHSRAALATTEQSTGRRLFEATLQGGALSAGRKTGQIAPGYLADLMALDGDHVDLTGNKGDTLLDSYIFAGDDRMVKDVWSAGRHMVQNGQHSNKDKIVAAYRKAMRDLKDDI
ncbi:MAG: formimidoylglutamate deiminase [Pelagimonas sp.]|jgi:formimidoylglutamate deiminase|nr:formimidoylglutamate deiminase [Pelagimonas sp.]